MMEKELLILGIIRTQKLHGYQLWELLKAVPMGVRLKRSNAYRILDSLKSRGFVNETREREGRRPERRVYEITEKGEEQFQEMLRQSLRSDSTPDLPGAVALNYLDSVPDAEALELIRERMASVSARVEENAQLSDAALNRHPGVGYAVAFDRFELSFLENLARRIEASTH
jgi:DNA-binding PadR family transcriptional regulator